MNSMIIGASAGLGRALSNELAANGHNLVLIASGKRDIEAVAADLRLRHGVIVSTVAVDVMDGDVYLARITEATDERGGIDGLFFPIGAVADADVPGVKIATMRRLMRINLLSVMETVTHFWPRLEQREGAVIVGFGSIAASRGRRNNATYSAAKRGLVSYFESLRHAAIGTGIRVQLYMPGYLDTSLAFGAKTFLLPPSRPEALARKVVRNLSKDIGMSYFPIFWRPICEALQLVPWSVFKKMDY
jgi:short-subunit dehydrogenase